MPTAESLDNPPVKNKGGRPSKYSSHILEKTKDYLENYKDYGDPVPSVAGLAQELDITRETVIQWGNDKKNKSKFSYMIQQLKAIQERSLLAGGLNSELNPSITKLVLSKHGYHDNPQANQGSSGITVQVNRGGVVLKSGNQELEIQTDQTAGKVIEHER